MAAGAPLDIEREAWTEGRRVVAGMDEAGRGPLAGPVVTAAVVLSPDTTFEGATDSKALPAARREELCARIRREARACSVGAASTREIEHLDILRATSLAMRWLKLYARSRDGRSFSDKLANEIIDAANERGESVKKREDTHRMADANKAFAHYRW